MGNEASEAMQKAIDLVGSQVALAAIIGVRPQAVQKWVASGRCPAERVLAVEHATDGEVTRYALRPDVFGEAGGANRKKTKQKTMQRTRPQG